MSTHMRQEILGVFSAVNDSQELINKSLRLLNSLKQMWTWKILVYMLTNVIFNLGL